MGGAARRTMARMQRPAVVLLLAAAVLPGAARADEPADTQALLKLKGCPSCHQASTRNVGPSFADIAARYRADPRAAATLAASIRGGSAGKWGGTAQMPAFAGLSEAQVEAMADWILGR